MWKILARRRKQFQSRVSEPRSSPMWFIDWKPRVLIMRNRRLTIAERKTVVAAPDEDVLSELLYGAHRRTGQL